MSSYEGKYDNFKILLSLSTDKLYISVLDEVIYDLYDLNISSITFNNNNIKINQLFNIIKKAIDNDDNSAKIQIEISRQYLKLKVLFEHDYFIFNEQFYLLKQINETGLTKELTKSYLQLQKTQLELKKKLIQIETKNRKIDSIIPVIKITIDEDEIEKKYNWFLNYLKTLIQVNPSVSEILIPKVIPNNLIEGKNLLNDLGWHYDIVYQQSIRQVLLNISAQYTIPEKGLYYYLKRRNIEVWSYNNNIYWMYIV
jgi:hypothetical protein